MEQSEKLERLLFVSRLREPGYEAKLRAIAERDRGRPGGLERAEPP